MKINELPQIVQEDMARYFMCDAGLYDVKHKDTRYWKRLIPFLALYQGLRRAIHRRMQDQYRINIDNHLVISYKSVWPKELSNAALSRNDDVVKRLYVDVNFPLQPLFYGNIVGDNRVFRKAKSMRVTMYHLCPNDVHRFPLFANWAVLAKAIFFHAPNVTSLTFEDRYAKCPNSLGPGHYQLAVEFMQALVSYRGLTSLSIRNTSMLQRIPWQQLLDVNTLSRIDILGDMLDREFALIRLNAATLQSIAITSRSSYVEMERLLRPRESTGCVVYPYVRSLTARIPYKIPQSDVNFEGIPFPQLEELCLGGEYPFYDDLLFRGNVCKMTKLNIKLTKHLDYVIHCYIIGCEQKFKSLQTLTVVVSDIPNTRKEFWDACGVISMIGYYALEIDISIGTPSVMFQAVEADRLVKAMDLKRLRLNGVPLSLCEIFKLLASLEQLERCILDVHPKITIGNFDKYHKDAEEIAVEHGHFANYLHALGLIRCLEDWDYETVRSVMWLASLCPALKNVIILSGWQSRSFKKNWRIVRDTLHFTQHVDRINNIGITIL